MIFRLVLTLATTVPANRRQYRGLKPRIRRRSSVPVSPATTQALQECVVTFQSTVVTTTLQTTVW